MRSMIFAISLMLMLVALTLVKNKPTNFNIYHVVYELYADDATIKEMMNHLSVQIEKEQSNLTLKFSPNLTALVQLLDEAKNYTGYNLSIPFNSTNMKLVGLENNTYINIRQDNGITHIQIYIPEYSNLTLDILANYSGTVLNWTVPLLSSTSDSELLLRMENYTMTDDDLCTPCYFDFATFRQKRINFTLDRYPNEVFEMNFTLYHKLINISYTGDPEIIISFNTTLSDSLVLSGNITQINMTNETTACEYAPLPRIPDFANATYISYGKVNDKNALVMNSTAGAVIYIDMNDNCRFDDLQDMKIAREKDFIMINNKVYHITSLNYITGCPIRWKVYANDSEDAWNESEIFEFRTTAPAT